MLDRVLFGRMHNDIKMIFLARATFSILASPLDNVYEHFIMALPASFSLGCCQTGQTTVVDVPYSHALGCIMRAVTRIEPAQDRKISCN